jgi:hypothetical protein
MMVDDEHVYQHFVLVFHFLLNQFNIVQRIFDMIFDIQALHHNLKKNFFCFILHHIDELISKKDFFSCLSLLCIFNTHCMSISIILFDLCCVEIHSFFLSSALWMVVKIDETVFMNCFFYIRLEKKFIFGVFCFLACIRKKNDKQRKLLYLYIFFVSCYVRNFTEKKSIKEYIYIENVFRIDFLFFVVDFCH